MSTQSRSTRRRSARVRDAQSTSGDEGANGSANMNGNGSAHPDAVAEASGDEERENIFLFWPNLIGSSLQPLPS